jgi:hypothetical protein
MMTAGRCDLQHQATSSVTADIGEISLNLGSIFYDSRPRL